ncbi:MAG: biotin/lipoyl-containing protein [Bacillota bacterium]
MQRRFVVTVDGVRYEVEVEEVREAAPQAPGPQSAFDRQVTPPVPAPKPPKPQAPSTGEGHVTAPMPGIILKVRVKPGERVQKGAVLMLLEAMKMENEILAPVDGTVAEVRVGQGQQVSAGDTLVTLG